MKNPVLLLLYFLAAANVFAQQKFTLTDCGIQMAGTSTLHDWTADVTKVSGFAEMEIQNNELTSITALSLTMDANSIKSEKGSMMDKNMYKALKTNEFPNLTFVFSETKSLQKEDGNYMVKINGTLTVAGTAQPISLTAIGKMNANGNLTFTGSKAMKMTDFDVEPPELFFGSLKTADEVTIIFEATFGKAGMGG